VFLSGMDMAMLTPAALREAVGYLPQEARLFSGSLRDNLLLGLPDPGDEAILEAARKSGLLPLFTRLLIVRDSRITMDGPRDEVMAKLSGKA